MKVAHITGSVSRRAGGPFASIRRLAQESACIGCEVEVLGLTDEFTEADRSVWDPIRPRAFTPRFPRQSGYAPALRRKLEHLPADLVHSHGLWMYPSWAAFRWSRRHRKPHVISIRGMLEPWAFRYHGWKKRPVWILWQRAALHAAAVLHATSETEADSIRSRGLKNPIALIPNGVDIPDIRHAAMSNSARRTALFLSRIHPKKGLLNLVQAWRQVRPKGWKLVIAGPDENGHLAEVQGAVSAAGISDTVSFAGAAYGEKKEALYRMADLFVLPTYSENFGIVVAEALAHQVPVITTTGAPWRDLVERDCGWWINIGVEPLIHALHEATECSGAERREMGERGRRLVEEKFSWPKIARQMKEVYEWVLGGGPKPDCFYAQ